MNNDDAVSRAGRIVYVEPNNIDNLHPNNVIPYLYEDYSVSVNLRVYNGNRYSCGFPEDFDSDWYDNFALEYSTNKSTITFIGGTNGYLSTNFTDISMNDPFSNTNECLGIESINITYDSWVYPQVKINFVDVRGASLMLPAEYEKYNSPESNFTSSSRASFFNSLFSFPYPLFKLSVKGFYGKEITYDKLKFEQKRQKDADSSPDRRSAVSDFCHARRNCYRGKLLAPTECEVADLGHAVRNCHTRQSPAPFKRRRPDARHACRNFHTRQSPASFKH